MLFHIHCLYLYLNCLHCLMRDWTEFTSCNKQSLLHGRRVLVFFSLEFLRGSSVLMFLQERTATPLIWSSILVVLIEKCFVCLWDALAFLTRDHLVILVAVGVSCFSIIFCCDYVPVMSYVCEVSFLYVGGCCTWLHVILLRSLYSNCCCLRE